jgi:hypothetical protein
MSETIEASPAPLSLRRRITLPQYGWRPKLRWFAAEIVVVVAGVLIALAINAWWAARQQAREELHLLAALLAEFSSNQPRLAELVAFHDEVKTTAQTLLALSADPQSSVSSDSVDRLLADVSWWSSYTTLESTVLDAAVEDGRLNLIRTDSLRQLLATWRAGAASAAAQSTQEFAHYSGVWLPILRAEGDLGQISNYATLIPGTATPYQGAPVPLPPRRTDHRPLVQSRALRNALVQKVWIEDDVLYQYRRLQPVSNRVVAALEREIRSRAHRSGAD